MKKTNKNTTTNTTIAKFENPWALGLVKNHGRHEMTQKDIKEFKKDPEIVNYGKWIMPESLIREYADQVYWYGVIETQNLSESFLREMSKRFKKNQEWYAISRHYRHFNDSFLKDFAKKLHWKEISASLTEEQIEKFADKVDWLTISQSKTLSKEFAKKHVKDIHWTDYYMHNYDHWFQGCFCIDTAEEVEKASKKYKGMFC